MIEEFAELVPESLLDKSGAAFYSGRCAFGAPSDLYILGANPGGTPENLPDDTVAKNVRSALKEAPFNWSDYRDGCWTPRCTKTRLQRGVMHLCDRLELDPGEVPASEVVFLRSRNLNEFEGNFEQLADQCWPFHQAVIDRLGVKVVACIGKRAGNWARHQLNAWTQTDEFVEKNERRWKSLSHRNADGLVVVTLTHASQASWTSPASDPTMLVKRALLRSSGKYRRHYIAHHRNFKPVRIKGEMISDNVIKDREDRV